MPWIFRTWTLLETWSSGLEDSPFDPAVQRTLTAVGPLYYHPPPMHDPIGLFERWYREAEAAGVPQADAMALATADRSGRPHVRFVLLKGVDERGFVFYTHSNSPKGRDLSFNPRAAAVFYWHATGRQVRIEGPVARVSAAEVDAYWSGRPRESNIGALLSRQSAPMRSEKTFLAAYQRLARSLEGKPVPRPARWTGYRIVPDRIEFWTRGDYRLHHRELFTRSRRGWKRTLLQP